MLPRGFRLVLLIAALVPGVWYAWQWRSMPHACEFHDDCLYYLGGKSLAETGSYRIESLPGTPAQTKYPPLFPAVLSIAWRIEPRYPDNLPVAMLLCWMWLPPALLLLCRWLRFAGLPPNAVLLIGAAWALNPYVIYFSTLMLSEMAFTCFLLATLLCMRPAGGGHGGLRLAATAGLLAGLAFLTRTAGVALLPAALLHYGLRRNWNQLALFAGGMLPSIAGWTLWSAANRAAGTDDVTLYYTNYFGYFLSSIQWTEFHLYIWKNVDGMLHGLGALLLPYTTDSILDKVFVETLAIAGLVGAVRLALANPRSAYATYATFAIGYVSMLAVWNFPPNERFMLPVAPLWAAGFYSEMRAVAANVGSVFRKPAIGQKIAGALIAGLLAGGMIYCGDRQWSLWVEGLPKYHQEHASRLRESETTIDWIRKNLPRDALFVTANDPLFYLRTGRRGVRLLPPTIYWYRDDHTARAAAYADSVNLGRERKLDYFLLNDWDWQNDLPPAHRSRLIESVRSDARLERVYSHGPTAVFRIR